MSHSHSNLDQSAADSHPADTHSASSKARLRIAFFGTNGSFSYGVLKQIHAEFDNIGAIFCDASEPYDRHLRFDLHRLDPPKPLGADTHEIPLHTNSVGITSSIIELGWKHEIPVYSVGRIRSQALADKLNSLHIDVACVACFNKRIPAALLKIPRLGFLNLHPSMLPAYRGPEPIQWILHDGAQGGVTIHWMDENFDTGDIAYQEEITFPSGTDYYAAEKVCTNRGGLAYLRVLNELRRGKMPRTPQGDDGFYRGRLGKPL